MNRYFIEHVDGSFWCENHFGYWSKFPESLKDRFEGVYFWVLPLYLSMKLYKVPCKLKRSQVHH